MIPASTSLPTSAHGPTITRKVSGALPLPIAATAAGTPAARRRAVIVLQADVDADAHSTRVGRRLPSRPFRNGSGNAPTTAGVAAAAPGSRVSHQTRSPGSTAVAA